MKVWIAKYALTKGIYECEVTSCAPDHPDMVYTINSWRIYFHNNEWFPTREEAVNRALAMIAAKQQAIKKQLTKLNDLAFKLKASLKS